MFQSNLKIGQLGTILFQLCYVQNGKWFTKRFHLEKLRRQFVPTYFNENSFFGNPCLFCFLQLNRWQWKLEYELCYLGSYLDTLGSIFFQFFLGFLLYPIILHYFVLYFLTSLYGYFLKFFFNPCQYCSLYKESSAWADTLCKKPPKKRD